MKLPARTAAMRLPPLPPLRDFINMYRLQARKILSQNYLMDMNVIRKIVRKAGDVTDKFVIEIGPGPGGITRAILEADCQRLDVIEIDRRFIPPLEILQMASLNRLHIHNENVMTADVEAIWHAAKVPSTSWYEDIVDTPCHVIGNLPFNIASPLIVRLLKDMSYQRGAWAFGRVPLTLTFQLEVAKRIVGKIASDSRSRLSLMAQYVSEPRLAFVIPGDCFVPKPEVDVGVVTFEPRIEPLISAPFELIEKVARTLFMHRRKKIVKNLKNLYPEELQAELMSELFHETGVDSQKTCVEIGIEELRELALHYMKQCQRLPGLYLYEYWKIRPIEEMKEMPGAVPQPYAFTALTDVKNHGMSFADFGKHFKNL